MITFCFGIYSIASFTHDENAETDSYIRTLLIDIKDVINYKYTFVIGVTILGAIIGSSLTVVTCILFYRSCHLGKV